MAAQPVSQVTPLDAFAKVENVIVVEQSHAAQALHPNVVEPPGGARLKLGGRDVDRGLHDDTIINQASKTALWYDKR
jgi:hypothetical protein